MAKVSGLILKIEHLNRYPHARLILLKAVLCTFQLSAGEDQLFIGVAFAWGALIDAEWIDLPIKLLLLCLLENLGLDLLINLIFALYHGARTIST